MDCWTCRYRCRVRVEKPVSSGRYKLECFLSGKGVESGHLCVKWRPRNLAPSGLADIWGEVSHG